ncbi:alpha/beta fold hydrolase [Nocardiopsis sediminis]|uniref:Alpha/beta fold hydrolase n=1 Tax=Nocardiopsis sediminis TaxID=1778267 RepID=A0ABV8FIA3_9ACTN
MTETRHPLPSERDRVIDSAGVPIAIRDFGGEGPPVLLLHGLGGTLEDWAPVAPLLTPHRRAVAVDLRNSGHSGDGPWEWDAVLGDIEAVAAAIGEPEPAVVGASIGGMIAVLWGERHPRCPGAVNLDGHPVLGVAQRHPGLDPDRAAEQREGLAAAFSAMEAQRADPLGPDAAEALAEAARAAARRIGASEASFAASVYRNLTAADGAGHRFQRPLPEPLARIRRAMEELDIFAAYERTRARTLAVLATEDTPGQGPFADLMAAHRRGVDEALAAIARESPHVRAAHLAGGHALLAERPADVARLALDFLAGHDG